MCSTVVIKITVQNTVNVEVITGVLNISGVFDL